MFCLFSLHCCLQLKGHGIPGMFGAHVQHHVAQEHKVEQEVLVVECHVVAAQQMPKIARVRQSIFTYQ